MEELIKSLEWYVKSIGSKYKVDQETVYKAMAESLKQSAILERIYNDTCFVIERDKGIQ